MIRLKHGSPKYGPEHSIHHDAIGAFSGGEGGENEIMYQTLHQQFIHCMMG